MRLPKEKLGLVAAAAILVIPLVGQARIWRTHYWLVVDGKQGTAVVTRERSHGVVDYRYSISGRDYTGRSQRNWEEKKYRNAPVGGESVVFFSSSRPWLSSLETPCFPIRGWPFTFIVLLVEVVIVTVLVRAREPRADGRDVPACLR
jgi:hypothetical protein